MLHILHYCTFNNAWSDTLLFADDLVLLSLSKEGLQYKVAKLAEYCDKWGLKVNFNKTKILIFNKQGAFINKVKFFIRGREIESVNQYNYLGFTLISSGKKHMGIENLINKGRRAWFSIQRMISKSEEKTVQTHSKLVDSLIKPILLYACESWGDSKNDISNKDIFNNKIEKFHLPMCKQILGVGKSMKVLAELGGSPYSINIETQMFKYFQRLPFLDSGTYLFQAFQIEINSEKQPREGWFSYLKKACGSYGLMNLANNIIKVVRGEIQKDDYKNKHNFFQKRAMDNYIQQNFHCYNPINENRNIFKGIWFFIWSTCVDSLRNSARMSLSISTAIYCLKTLKVS